MTLISNAFFFIVALGILVTIHEFGHFWVARKLGVKVLTFSVGFGKALWQRKAKDGVNYVIATIPLGGYVKMLDEREGDVAETDKVYAFNNQSVWARMAIVLAGPVANFILAIALYWMMFGMGISGLTTEMGKIEQHSIAGQAGLRSGDVIKQVDGQEVVLLKDALLAFARRLGETSEIELLVESSDTRRERSVLMSLTNWDVDTEKPDILKSLGIRHQSEDLLVEPVIALVGDDSAAATAGIQAGDRIKSYNGQIIEDWDSLVAYIKPNAGQSAELIIERNGELRELSVVIGSQQEDGKTVGLLGVSPVGPDYSALIATRKGGFLESLDMAVIETGKMISLTVQLFKKLLTGDISPKSLSGPISIAEGAGGSARGGLVHFLSFVAMISVNLGFINLLPIPLLDGGHLLFFSIEAIKGKPLSEKVQEIGMQIGMLMVFALMAIAIFNDLSRL